MRMRGACGMASADQICSPAVTCRAGLRGRPTLPRSRNAIFVEPTLFLRTDAVRRAASSRRPKLLPLGHCKGTAGQPAGTTRHQTDDARSALWLPPVSPSWPGCRFALASARSRRCVRFARQTPLKQPRRMAEEAQPSSTSPRHDASGGAHWEMAEYLWNATELVRVALVAALVCGLSTDC